MQERTRGAIGEGFHASTPPSISGLVRSEICWYSTASAYTVNLIHDSLSAHISSGRSAAKSQGRDVACLRDDDSPLGPLTVSSGRDRDRRGRRHSGGTPRRRNRLGDSGARPLLQ